MAVARLIWRNATHLAQWVGSPPAIGADRESQCRPEDRHPASQAVAQGSQKLPPGSLFKNLAPTGRWDFDL